MFLEECETRQIGSRYGMEMLILIEGRIGIPVVAAYCVTYISSQSGRCGGVAYKNSFPHVNLLFVYPPFWLFVLHQEETDSQVHRTLITAHPHAKDNDMLENQLTRKGE